MIIYEINKTFPCKHFHRPESEGTCLNENCKFIHIEQFKGAYVPKYEIEKVRKINLK